MRTTLSLTVACLLVASPAFGDVGEIYMQLLSNGSSSVTVNCPAPGQPCVVDIPIELYVTATTSGIDGPNNGLAVTFTDIIGDCLAGIMQDSMTPSQGFADSWAPYYGHTGCGFDLFAADTTGGTGSSGIIAGVGNAQNGEGSGPALPGDVKGAATADAAQPVGDPPLLIATGVLHVSIPCGTTCEVKTWSNGALWKMDNSYDGIDDQLDSRMHQSTLTIECIIPEPSSLLLLAPAALILSRRRRIA